jgi:hypothetical protein
MPAAQIASFIARFTPQMQKQAREARRLMRKRMPTATELVYDNYNGLVFGYGPSEKAGQAILSLVILKDHVTLCLLFGATLLDPEKLLLGEGVRVRHIKLEAASDLKKPAIRFLIDQAIERNRWPLPAKGKGTTQVRAVVAKQRPRR